MNDIFNHLENAEKYLKQSEEELQKAQELFEKDRDINNTIKVRLGSLVSETQNFKKQIERNQEIIIELLIEFAFILRDPSEDPVMIDLSYAWTASHKQPYPDNFYIYSLNEFKFFNFSDAIMANTPGLSNPSMTFQELIKELLANKSKQRDRMIIDRRMIFTKLLGHINDILEKHPEKIKKLLDSRTEFFKDLDALKEKVLVIPK